MTDNTAPITAAPSTNDTPNTSDTRKTNKARRVRPRRRGASDSESSDHTASDASSVSSASDPESEDDEEEAVEEVVDTSEKVSVFPDASSTTPAAWADSVDEKVGELTEEVTFNEFNRGETGTKGERKDGKKVFTEEQTRRYEEKKARMKEKQKAKRAELKEAKRKEKEMKGSEGSASASAAPLQHADGEGKKGKGHKRDKEKPSITPASLVASTSALTIDDSGATPSPSIPTDPTSATETQNTDPAPHTSTSRPTPSAPRTSNSREAYAERLAKDPKFTPRVGGFWTHDQRHYESGPLGEGGYGGLRQMSGYWRGRGEPRGAFRGGFRGRGRGFGGFAPRGGFAQPSPGAGRELTEDLGAGEGEGKGKMLEMDRLEAELEARRAQVVQPVEVEAPAAEEEQAEEVGVEEPPKPVEPAAPTRAGKWGHEGFESMTAVEQFQANRMMRGRGRGRPFFARGGPIPRPHFQHPLNRPFLPVAPRRPSPLTVTPTEDNATQPAADSLLEDNAVKVKMPGTAGEAIEIPPTPPVAPVANGTVGSHPPAAKPSTSNAGEAGASAAARPGFRPQAPVFVQSRPNPVDSAPSPHPTEPAQIVPVQPAPIPLNSGPSILNPSASSPQPHLIAAVATGSESGSISSNGHYAPPQQQFLPPGVAVGANGEYYNISAAPTAVQQPQFYNQRQYVQQQQQQQYYPQSYSPDFYQTQSRHGSFSSQPGQPPFIDGRGSPYPPYPAGNAFFVPPRQTKVSIRAPTAGAAGVDGQEGEDGKTQASGDQPSDGSVASNGVYYSQHYNPYASVTVPVNGGAVYGPGGQQMLNGGAYQGQGYWPNGGEYGGYGEYGNW